MEFFSFNTKTIIIVTVLLLIILLSIIVYYYFKRESDDVDDFDNSDVPIPPSSLEYNRSLCPTRRNNNLTGASGAISRIRKDYQGNPYYIIDDDIYNL